MVTGNSDFQAGSSEISGPRPPRVFYAREDPREPRAYLLLVGSLAIRHRALTLRLASVTRQPENDRLVHFFCKLLMRLTNVVSDLAFSKSEVRECNPFDVQTNQLATEVD